MVTNYDRAKKWFFIGFGCSVNYFNAEHDPDYKDDNDLMDLFEDKWAEMDLGPVWYKEYLKEKKEKRRN